MKSAVPYLREEAIEAEASTLLAEFARDRQPVEFPPVPIDDIIELQLQLSFEIKDLCRLFGVGDVHGAIWFHERRIAVDKQLDPDLFPAKRGRYHFTLAHEAGHWRLHRKHFVKPSDQGSLFDGCDVPPDYICRSSQKKIPVEWQADSFAANLLMPRSMVIREWKKWRGDPDAIVLPEIPDRQERLKAELIRRGCGKSGRDGEGDMVLENLCRPFAEQFQVSAEAMRIRLEDIGLLLRERVPSLFD